MARVKYAPGTTPLFNGNTGLTFMSNPVGQSAKTNSKTRHFRSGSQLEKMSMFSSIARLWNHLSNYERSVWVDWVAYCPQVCKRNPAITIGPFQNFQKRNFYRFLELGEDFSIMSIPELVTYEIDLPVFSAKVDPDKLVLYYEFDRSVGDLVCLIFLFNPSSSAVNTSRSADRYMLSIPTVSGHTNITSQFISQFGKLPLLGKAIIIRSIECGVNNGQFFYPVLQKVQTISTQTRINLATTRNANYGFKNIYSGYLIDNYQTFLSSGFHLDSLTINIVGSPSCSVTLECEIYEYGYPDIGVLVGTSSNQINWTFPQSAANTFNFNIDLSAREYVYKIKVLSWSAPYGSAGATLNANSNNQYQYGSSFIIVNGTRYNQPTWDHQGFLMVS